MRLRSCYVLGALLILCSSSARADAPASQPSSLFSKPIQLSLQPEPPSVYAPPAAPREEVGLNEGGVHVRLDVNYMTDYVFRGLDRSDGTGLAVPGQTPKSFGHEDAPNLQFDGQISWDLGKLPHPYVQLFVNVDDSDPVSRFQIVQPIVGFEWNLRPIIVEAGQQTFLYPERDEINTSEVFAKLTLDDSFYFHTDQPILSPYIYAAYDYDLYDGSYFQVGVKHDFPIEGTGVTITALADVAYVIANQQFSVPNSKIDTGFQHYDLGLIGSFSLNSIFNLSRRYGEFSIKGYLYYTDGLSNKLLADTQVWGGCGISFKY